MKWTEGHIHLAMRKILKAKGWSLIAGEYPGGSDHELYPLNVVDPTVARDNSPDPRRHSLGELIPDIVALKGRRLLIGEAKVSYNDGDKCKLDYLLTDRREDLQAALEKFSFERGFQELLPISTLQFIPTLIFTKGSIPYVGNEFGLLVIASKTEADFFGPITDL